MLQKMGLWLRRLATVLLMVRLVKDSCRFSLVVVFVF